VSAAHHRCFVVIYFFSLNIWVLIFGFWHDRGFFAYSGCGLFAADEMTRLDADGQYSFLVIP
jgi:hypothetical protein